MTDIIEKAAEKAYFAYGFASPWTDEHRHHGVAQPDTKDVFRSVTRAVIRSLRDNTDSPRVCDELTRMLGEEG